jgi:putative ABC transport system permease protein
VEEQVTLGENEVLVFAIGGAYGHAALKFLDWSFVVKEELEDLPAGGLSSTQSLGSYYVVVRDPGIMEALLQHPTLQGSRGAYTGYKLGFDLDTSREQALALYRDLKETLSLQEEAFTMVESREAAREDFLVLYGGLFFLGIFLGTLFMLGTVLIIYYKQITEGYEDRRRYVILRQVGMSSSEVKGSIKSQVLSVFYLPLAVAAVHVAFSFPMVTKVLVVFNLTDKGLFALCTAATFAAFAMLYALVYRATTRVYYRIAAAP